MGNLNKIEKEIEKELSLMFKERRQFVVLETLDNEFVPLLRVVQFYPDGRYAKCEDTNGCIYNLLHCATEAKAIQATKRLVEHLGFEIVDPEEILSEE